MGLQCVRGRGAAEGAADCSGMAVCVRIDSEWVQVPFDIKSTFFGPEEVAPWLEQCKNTYHKAVVFRNYHLTFAFAGSALQ